MLKPVAPLQPIQPLAPLPPLPPLQAKGAPFCRDCGQRKVAQTPRNLETKTCWRCYKSNHNYHLCPIAGCTVCDGEE